MNHWVRPIVWKGDRLPREDGYQSIPLFQETPIYAKGIFSTGTIRFAWDPGSDRVNREKYGISFDQAPTLFENERDVLEFYDEEHSGNEDRFIALGSIGIGAIVVIFTEPEEDLVRILSAPRARVRSVNNWKPIGEVRMSDTIRELTDQDLARAIPRRQRQRIVRGEISGGEDVIAIRRFLRMTQEEFASALGIKVHTLRNWEQDRRRPEGPAIALLRIAARHPHVLRENFAVSA